MANFLTTLRNTLPSRDALVSALSAGAGKGDVDNPRRDVLFGAGVVGAFFVLFLGWATFARLDVAAAGQGVVAVSGARQTVQHREGGIISRIYVKEGQSVAANQPLVALASSELTATEQALAARVIARKVEVARLEAEQSNTPFVTPVEFAGWSGDERAAADRAVANAIEQLRVQQATNSARRAILQRRIAQTQQEIEGAQMQIQSSQTQARLNEEELRTFRSLAAQGYAPQTKIRELERNAAALQGDVGARGAQVAGLRSSIGATTLEIGRGDSERLQQIQEELRLAHADLQSIEPQWIAAREQVARSTIRAPVAGAVVGLSVNTVGGVIAPGQAVMTIVPKAAPLVVDAKFLPRDVDGLTEGKTAEVRFPGLHDRNLPLINGVLTRLSADTLSDERTGVTYYTGQVTVPEAELAKVNARGHAHELRPGQPADVLIPLRKRTALQYILEPLFGVFWSSLRER